MTRPIFIFGAPKSGTSLLRSLLDGHPDLFCAPVETHALRHLGWWIPHPFVQAPAETRDTQAFSAAVLAWVARCNENQDAEGGSHAPGVFDMTQVEASLRASLPADGPEATPAACIDAYLRSLHAGVHGSPMREGQRWVEKSVEHVEFGCDLVRLFPEACFIHIVRNPYANLVALRRFMMQQAYPKLYRHLRVLSANAYSLQAYERLLPNYRVVRFEDLILNTEATMRRVAAACALPWHEALTQPTQAGKAWQGNSTTEQRFQGISDAPLHHWQQAINSLEVALVNRYLPTLLARHDYEARQPSHSPYWPVAHETPSRYVFNRILLSYCKEFRW